MANPEDRSLASEPQDEDAQTVDFAQELVGKTAATIPEIQIDTTRPERILRHDISDDDLDVLTSSHRDGIVEVIAACVGVAFGSLIPAIGVLKGAYWDTSEVPVSFLGQLEIVLLFGSIFVGLALNFVRGRRKKTAITRADEIRSRADKLE